MHSGIDLEHELLSAASASRGHFAFESGHHGDLWLDLDAMLVDARHVAEWVDAFAREFETLQPDLVCGLALDTPR